MAVLINTRETIIRPLSAINNLSIKQSKLALGLFVEKLTNPIDDNKYILDEYLVSEKEMLGYSLLYVFFYFNNFLTDLEKITFKKSFKKPLLHLKSNWQENWLELASVRRQLKVDSKGVIS